MSTFMKQISTQIRRIRKEQGLTQTMLAKKSGLNFRYIGFIEQGRISTSVKTIEKITKALSIEMCELCANTKTKRRKLKAPSKKEQAIDKIVRQLQASNIKRVRNFAKILRLIN